MPHRRVPTTSILAILVLCGCASKQPAPAVAAKEEMQTEDLPRPSAATISDVMRAKTAWASSLLEAIAMRNYVLVENNAEALRKLSLESSFMVQDTVSYRALADRFRLEVAQLAADARAGNQREVEASYHRVTEACFHCHAHVRGERSTSDMSGKVS